MKPIPILGVGLQSKSSNVTAQSRVNCYMDNSDDKNTVVAIGRPGLTLALELYTDYIRAIHVSANFLWLVVFQRVYKITESSGIFTSVLVGSVHYASGFVEITDNGLQVIFTDNSQYIYTYTLATSTFAAMTDADYPYSATQTYQSVCFLDSYIVANKPGTQQFQWSASYDATSWDALDIASAESHPDNVVKLLANNGYLYVFGKESIEFFTSDSSGFSVVKGLTLSNGLAAIESPAKIQQGVACLTTNKNGTSQVSIVSPGQIIKISTSDIDALINSYATVFYSENISDATGFSFVLDGHEFYQINFTARNISFLYDVTMGLWSQLKSSGIRHYGNKSVKFNNKTYVSDYRSNGRLYFIDEFINTDNGTAIELELTSKHVFNDLEKVSIKSIQIDAETGMLSDAGASITPDMTLMVSKDNGKTFSTTVLSMGASGDYTKRIRKNRLGVARDWVFKLKITAAVKRVILGAYVELN